RTRLSLSNRCGACRARLRRHRQDGRGVLGAGAPPTLLALYLGTFGMVAIGGSGGHRHAPWPARLHGGDPAAGGDQVLSVRDVGEGSDTGKRAHARSLVLSIGFLSKANTREIALE